VRVAAFRELFGGDPDVVARAPGRVNLIGEHTDYNDGFVLPAAIPLDTEVQLARRRDSRVQVWSTAFPDTAPVSFDLDALTPVRDWTDYVRAMFSVLRERGISSGVDLRIDSTIPLGSGLSSSAALLVALARALRQAFGVEIDDVEIAVLARRAENEFVGAPVGIMDQMASSLADATSALLIDTRSLAHERIPLPSGARLLVIDSGIRHAHASGGYRARREECQRAAAALGVRALRDVAMTDLSRVASLPPPLDRRARHVVTENARVLDTADALRRGDLARAGELFLVSHASMRDDFAVSVAEVDALVEDAADTPGVFGARLTGGGFGGSIVALVEPSRVRRVGAAVLARHRSRFESVARIVVPSP
jgi:galactokinase